MTTSLRPGQPTPATPLAELFDWRSVQSYDADARAQR
jgi:hypothetical protein